MVRQEERGVDFVVVVDVRFRRFNARDRGGGGYRGIGLQAWAPFGSLMTS